ncbi:MAG: LysR substrate-binding domain-containing protein [Bacteroidota bacterium]
MNLNQLEYILAVDKHRHFAKAAKACFVTQPTLSMMIHKLEEELDVKIFDRRKKPVLPTEIGVQIIEQARKTLVESRKIKELVGSYKDEVDGQLRLGVIPTLAPYLLPLFIQSFLKKYPLIRLKISEYTTETIIDKLEKGAIDVGILVTPLNHKRLSETPLFYETFLIYSSYQYDKKYLLPEDLNLHNLWLLEEGHCFRSQILNLCELRKKEELQLEYAAGSIETLRQLVENQQGVTILPELSTRYLSDEKRKKLMPFRPPAPAREVSLVTHQDFVKRRLVDILQKEIIASLPQEIVERKEFERIDI